MTVLALDSNYDICLDGNGQIKLLTGRDAYAQTVKNAICTILGEVQSNTSLGIPYFTTVFESTSNLQTWRNSVITRIREFPFVMSIDKFDVDVNYTAKTLSYKMWISTDLGGITIKG